MEWLKTNKIDRIEFLLVYCVAIMIAIFLTGIFALFSTINVEIVTYIVLIICYPILIIGGMMRCRDTGISGWFVIFHTIPTIGIFIILVFMIIPSNYFKDNI